MFWKFFSKSADTPKTSPPIKPNTEQEQALPTDFLKQLIPVGELSEQELNALDTSLKTFKAGQIIFNRGESADALIYLHKGHVYLEAANGSGYSVEENTFKAYYPLSTATEQAFSAIAKTTSQIAFLPLSALQRSTKTALANNPLLKPEDIPWELAKSPFFQGFCDAFQRDDLHVPTLPDVAIRLRRALQQDISISEAAKIVNLDPVIASKLIQVANSPLYRSINPIANSHDAINRLGFRTTQNLVTSISLHNLFRCTNKHLNQRAQLLWKQSIQIASLSYTLAGLSRRINPDEALLAGLTYNIGVLPIITYAETLHENTYHEQELEDTINLLQGVVGAHILKKWHFPENLQSIPRQATHWYHDEHPELQLSDMVLLARFHAQLGTPQAQNLPPLNTLPAFLKLGERTLTPDMSLQALQEAKQQIAEAVSFFRG